MKIPQLYFFSLVFFFINLLFIPSVSCDRSNWLPFGVSAGDNDSSPEFGGFLYESIYLDYIGFPLFANGELVDNFEFTSYGLYFENTLDGWYTPAITPPFSPYIKTNVNGALLTHCYDTFLYSQNDHRVFSRITTAAGDLTAAEALFTTIGKPFTPTCLAIFTLDTVSLTGTTLNTSAQYVVAWNGSTAESHTKAIIMVDQMDGAISSGGSVPCFAGYATTNYYQMVPNENFNDWTNLNSSSNVGQTGVYWFDLYDHQYKPTPNATILNSTASVSDSTIANDNWNFFHSEPYIGTRDDTDEVQLCTNMLPYSKVSDCSTNAWYRAPMAVVNGFEAEFRVKTSTGRGLAFLISQNDDNITAVGCFEGCLGYHNLSKTIAVEINIDTPAASVAFQSVKLSTTPVTPRGTYFYHIRVSYDGQTITVYLYDQNTTFPQYPSSVLSNPNATVLVQKSLSISRSLISPLQTSGSLNPFLTTLSGATSNQLDLPHQLAYVGFSAAGHKNIAAGLSVKSFEMYSCPSPHQIDPSIGNALNSTVVNIYGNFFINESFDCLSYLIDSAERTPRGGQTIYPKLLGLKANSSGTFVNSTHIQCTIPPLAVGLYVVEISRSTCGAPSTRTGLVFESLGCPPGYSSPNNSLPGCNACPPGKSQSQYGKTTCDLCPVSSYSSSIAAAKCTLCGAGQLTDGKGSNSPLDCRCPSGLYFPDLIESNPEASALLECLVCPVGGSCDGRTAVSAKGYFESKFKSAVFIPCQNPESCTGNSGCDSKGGYDGYLCQECKPGYQRIDEKCSQCGAAPVVLTIGFVFALFLLGFALLKITRGSSINDFARLGSVSIFVTFAQIVSFYSQILAWKNPLKNILAFLSIFNFDIDMFFAPECSSISDWGDRWLFSLSLPFLMALSFLIIYWSEVFRNWIMKTSGTTLLKRHPAWMEKPVLMGQSTKSSPDEVMLTPLDMKSTFAPSPIGEDLILPPPPDSSPNVDSPQTPPPALKFPANNSNVSLPVPPPPDGDTNRISIDSTSNFDPPNNSTLIDDDDDMDDDDGDHDSFDNSDAFGENVATVEYPSKNLRFHKANFRFHLIESIFKTRSTESLKSLASNCYSGFLMFLILAYIPLVIKASEIYACKTLPDGKTVVSTYPQMECESERWSELVQYAVWAFILYGFGIPTYVIWFLSSHKKKLENPDTIQKHGFLYLRYDSKLPLPFWELAILFRKLLIVSAFPMFAGQPIRQSTFILVILALSYFAQRVFNPYRFGRHNTLASFTLLVAIVTLYLGQLVHQQVQLEILYENLDEESAKTASIDNDPDGATFYVIFASILVILCIMVCIISIMYEFKSHPLLEPIVRPIITNILLPIRRLFIKEQKKQPSKSVSRDSIDGEEDPDEILHLDTKFSANMISQQSLSLFPYSDRLLHETRKYARLAVRRTEEWDWTPVLSYMAEPLSVLPIPLEKPYHIGTHSARNRTQLLVSATPRQAGERAILFATESLLCHYISRFVSKSKQKSKQTSSSIIRNQSNQDLRKLVAARSRGSVSDLGSTSAVAANDLLYTLTRKNVSEKTFYFSSTSSPEETALLLVMCAHLFRPERLYDPPLPEWIRTMSSNDRKSIESVFSSYQRFVIRFRSRSVNENIVEVPVDTAAARRNNGSFTARGSSILLRSGSFSRKPSEPALSLPSDPPIGSPSAIPSHLKSGGSPAKRKSPKPVHLSGKPFREDGSVIEGEILAEWKTTEIYMTFLPKKSYSDPFNLSYFVPCINPKPPTDPKKSNSLWVPLTMNSPLETLFTSPGYVLPQIMCIYAVRMDWKGIGDFLKNPPQLKVLPKNYMPWDFDR